MTDNRVILFLLGIVAKVTVEVCGHRQSYIQEYAFACAAVVVLTKFARGDWNHFYI